MRSIFFRAKKTYAHMSRYRHIMTVLMKYGFEEVAGTFARRLRVGFGSKGPGTARMRNLAQTSLPQRIRLALQELGPTFVKMGQLLSTRPDLVGADYIAELEKLQDQVKPEKYERIRDQIKQHLGAFPEELFEQFDTVPIAAASIGQVYRARTKDGHEVVVKVRRPGVVKTLRTEMEILGNLANLAKTHFVGTDDSFDPVRMVHEFCEAVNKEVDYDNERRNQQRFAQNFADDPTVHIPAIYEAYCSQGVLTMEYIDGIKPSRIEQLQAMGMDPKVIAVRGADFVLKQVFDYGFFHADPHPGNFLVTEGNVLCPLDFGQVGRLTKQDRMLLRYFILAIVSGDANKLIHGLERAQVLDEDADLIELERDLEEILETYTNLPIKDIPFGEAINRAFEVIRHHKIIPPRDFTLMLKCLMTIESFSTELDREFQIFNHLKPYARKFAFEEIKPENLFRQVRKISRGASEFASRFPEDASAIITKFRRGKFSIHVHHEHLEELEQTLDNSSNRIAFAVIIAALLVGSSLIVPQEGGLLGLITYEKLGIIGYLAAMIMGVWLLISIIRNRRY